MHQSVTFNNVTKLQFRCVKFNLISKCPKACACLLEHMAPNAPRIEQILAPLSIFGDDRHDRGGPVSHLGHPRGAVKIVHCRAQRQRMRVDQSLQLLPCVLMLVDELRDGLQV